MTKRNGFMEQPNRHTDEERDRLTTEGVAAEMRLHQGENPNSLGSRLRIAPTKLWELIEDLPDRMQRAAVVAAYARDREAVTGGQADYKRAEARLRIREATKDARLTEADLEARISLDPGVVKADAVYRYACAHTQLTQAEVRALGTLEKMIGHYAALLPLGLGQGDAPDFQVLRLRPAPPCPQG